MKQHLEYFDHDTLLWVDYSFEYPNDIELLNIFPEAKEIIQAKLSEWTREKQALMEAEVRPIYRKLRAIKDQASRDFWTKVYLAKSGRRRQIKENLARLNELQALITRPGLQDAHENFNILKARAKEHPIVELYDFQKLRRSGKGYLASCPWHEDRSPSFQIFPDNKFRCWSCSASGDSIRLVQQLYNYSFPEAVKSLAGGGK
nr:hypothetical protein 12 [bacterium]